ncbi:MAG TPA: S41 family peptidase [bacterium]|nr:S41 family peptidase [bacterium]
MLKNIVLVLLLFFAIVLNGDIFDRLFSTSKGSSLSQAEVTLFALHAIQNRYLNKQKLQPEDLLDRALDAIQEEFAEIVTRYDREGQKVFLQVYNKEHIVEVKRMRDLWDIAIVLRQVYNYLEKDYKPEGDREMSDIEYVAINGILKKLDPHSYIFTPKEFEEFTSSTEGNFGGLGIVIQTNEDGEITVVSPMDGTPAARAGILSGDVIVQINDESAINMALNKAVERMRGEPGTKVTLYVKRKGVPSVIRFELERAIIKIQSVIPAMPEKGVGYIKLTGFMENTYTQFADTLVDLKKKGMRSLILDMRNNSGGLLTQAIKISDLFLDKGVIVSTVGDDEKEVSEAEKEASDILDIPIVVMVNEGSASATEIVAAALKKNGRATVVGRRTFGKGSVQNLFRIPRGGGLKLTIAQYLTPGDISIQTIGVEPDIEYQPSYIDARKLSLFKTRSDMLGEKDLKEHIVSAYMPKELDKPQLTIYYAKPYRTPEEIQKESRREKVGVFKNDEEIQLTIDFLKMRLTRQEPILTSAERLRDDQMSQIVGKLEKLGIPWKKTAATSIKASDLKISLVSDPSVRAGADNKLTFRAVYPGAVDNLDAAFDTDIPFLRNLEIPFGSFSGSVERTVSLTLPEHMSWRRQPVRIDLSVDRFHTVVKSEQIDIETVPMEQPEVRFSLLAEESVGSLNGLVEEGDEITARIMIKNTGKGAILDGRLQLINVNNSPELFINKGTEPIMLGSGEEKEVLFTFKIATLHSEKSRIAIAVSLYDYKTKYAAGFSIPFVPRDHICRYEEKGVGPASLIVGTKMFADIRLKTPIAVLSSPAAVKTTGRCGDEAIRIEGGYWLRSADIKPVAVQPPPSSGKLLLQRQYDIAMPVVTIDRGPISVASPEGRVAFSIAGDDVQDIFLYQNNKKVFYYRLAAGEARRDFSVSLKFREKTNKMTIVVKGKDRERIGTAVKYIYFPGGDDEARSEGGDE